MGAVKQAVSDLMRMLNRRQKEAARLPATLDRLESYLREEPKKIIHLNLFLLLTRIEGEAARKTRETVVVFISPEGMVSVRETHNVKSDSWLERLKSQEFSVLSLEEFKSFVQSLKSQVAQGNFIPTIEFLRANTEFQRALPINFSSLVCLS